MLSSCISVLLMVVLCCGILAALLKDWKLLDLPKLLDICAVYDHDNHELTSHLVCSFCALYTDLQQLRSCFSTSTTTDVF